MTKPKYVARTLKSVLDNPTLQSILDKSHPIDDVITYVSSWWGYDLYTRRPGPAYDELSSSFVGTDLDLSCFLYALADRQAVINLPSYSGLRRKTVKEGQVVTSAENRHGNIVGVVSNKEVFTFSIRIIDANVMTTDKVGDFRNFSLTDFEGNWYNGWQKIEFMPSAKENAFLTENKLWSENTVIFKNFVHPNRWISLYGHHYFITKALINRLREESTHYKTLIQQMLDSGIQYPPGDVPAEWPEQTKEEGKSIKVTAFQVELDLPKEKGMFPLCEFNQKNLVDVTRKRKDFIYKIIPKLSFATRSTELAFYKYGRNGNGEIFPSWLENVKWERNYIIPGKRIKWDRLVLFQPGVGERAVSIRKREYEKSEQVSLNYDERDIIK